LYAANVIGLTTANVAEVGNNIFYTNARVYSNTIALLPTLAGSGIAIAANGQISSTAAGSYANANVAAFLTTYTGNITAGNITTNVMIGQGGGSISGANLISTNIISSSIWTGLYASNVVGLTTANVSEVGNLYYTNARVYSNTIALLPTLAGSGISIAANGQISSTATGSYGNANVQAFLTTYSGNINAGNVIANAIIGRTGGFISGANLISTNIISSSIWTGLYASNVVGLTTANVVELTNLYYTNARVYSNTIALLPTLAGSGISIAANGQISSTATGSYANANVAAFLPTYTGNLTAGNLIVTDGIIDTTGSLSIVTGLNSNIELTATGNGRIILDGQTWPHADGANGYVLQTNGTGNLFWSAPATGFSNANVQAFLTTYTGNVSAGNVIANAIIGRTGGFISGANLISTNIIVASTWTGLYAANVIGLTTANVSELTNLYYTNARVYANVINLLNIKANITDITTANITEVGNNLFYTNARVYSNVISLLNAKANVSDLTTANVAELTNLYYTNARVYSNVIGLINSKANVADITTANVAELTNLYYTNARVYSNVIGLLNAKANVSDLTTANVAEVGNNTFYSNARVDARVQNLTVNVNTSANIIANTFIMRGTGNASLVSSTDFTLQATGNLNLLGANVVTANLLFIGQNSGAVTATNDFSISATGNINLNASNITTTSNTLTLQGSGVPTLFSDSVLSINATTGVYITASPLRLASMTTTQRNTFTAANGDLIYNITTNKFQGYENGAWVNLI
jgi:hypothetical protein